MQKTLGQEEPDGKFLELSGCAEEGNERFSVQDEPDRKFCRDLVHGPFHLVPAHLQYQCVDLRLHGWTIP